MFGGQLSVVGGLIEDLLVGQWLVVGGLSGQWFCNTSLFWTIFLALKKISFFVLYWFSTEVCPVPSVILCYICGVKA